jgi:hypothetical protein
MFGIGMTYASGCGNKVLIRVGGGNLKSLVVLIVAGIMAYIMTRTDFYGIIFHSWMNPISLDLAQIGIIDQSLPTIISSIFSINNSTHFNLILGVTVSSIMIFMIFKSGKFIQSFDNVFSGIIVGSVIVTAWLLTGGVTGQEWIEANDFLDDPLPSVGMQARFY